MNAAKRVMSALSRRLFPPASSAPAIWAGVYASFDQIPHVGEGFSSQDAAAAAEGLLRETQADPMPYEAIVDHQLLAHAVRLVGKDHVSVVDFGGGVGQSYAALRRMIDARIGLRYCVVELPPVVRHARALWLDSPEISFEERLETVPFTPDVVFAKGAIQYWPQYTGILRQLLASRPSWLVLEKVSMLVGREYATEQINVYGSRIPYWFMDLDRLVATAAESGYRLVLHRRLEREYDQSNFPPELRSGRAASLLFEHE